MGRKIFIGIMFCFFQCMPIFSQSAAFPPGAHDISILPVTGIRTDLLKNIAPIIEKSIAAGEYPGAVVLAAHRGHIIYRGVFGNRSILPLVAPMQFDTIFDVASLTKVLATTPAILQLMEQGKLELDAPVAKYWPQFAVNGKEGVTIREMLTHTSGLPADISTYPAGKNNVLDQIEKLELSHLPGTAYLYSDLNFIVLGHIVEVISHEPLNEYVQHHIFKPLNMTSTSYLPADNLRDRIAPTEMVNHELRWGKVHDPGAYAMQGISGNAGVFSTANDIGLYAQCLLNNGRITSASNLKKKPTSYLLGPLTILKMTTPQMSPTLLDIRGLGWDLDSAFSSRGILFPAKSYGHTGWTGASLWIDPVTQTWLIVLSNRIHPKALSNNQIVQDRRAIANIIAASITDVVINNLNNTGDGELVRAYH
jgi:CubicO group peptidase (beta-lactamase class C family)